jgi:hypothetical protein
VDQQGPQIAVATLADLAQLETSKNLGERGMI